MPPVVDLTERGLIPVTALDDGMMIYLSDGTTRCLQIYNANDAAWIDMYCMPIPAPPSITYYQGFEDVPATPELTYSGGSGTILSAIGGTTPNSPIYSEGSKGYVVSSSDSTISFDAIDATGFANINLSFDLASFSTTTGNGVEPDDVVEVLVSTDNSTWSSEVIVKGINNARWDFNGTGIAAGVYDGDNTATSYAPTTGGTKTGSEAYSTVTLSNLPSVSNLYIQIRMLNDTSKEKWIIDNVVLSLN